MRALGKNDAQRRHTLSDEDRLPFLTSFVFIFLLAPTCIGAVDFALACDNNALGLVLGHHALRRAWFI